jgi:hypothetical protein
MTSETINGTVMHHGTERDYLKWRLNEQAAGRDPGAPKYAEVRSLGFWTSEDK